MDRTEALQAYLQAVLPEQESYLYQRALHSVRAVTRGMKPEERESYLQSRAFQSVLYRYRKSDRVYQGLLRGELVLDVHRLEFERLTPLILSELRHGRAIELPFLRSVAKGHVTLKKAHGAVSLLREGEVKKHLEERKGKLQEEAEHRVERWLRSADLSRLLGREERVEQVLPAVMKAGFERGVPERVVDQACRPLTP